MNSAKSRVDEMLNDLKQERDELRLKIKLAKMEANEEWAKLEAKLARLETKARELKSATEDSSKEIGAAAKLLGEEIRDGFKNIARHL
ncbi:MAG: hypothetical protein R3F50_21770 [Gammaproteobacteria bacterium]|jgi:SMC interacting uncharacterized protein involved in chromosome segregation